MKKLININEAVLILGLAGMMGAHIALGWIMSGAIFNEGIVVLDFNHYGEMWIEVAMWLILTPMVISVWWKAIKSKELVE